jgi:hypothetical protein
MAVTWDATFETLPPDTGEDASYGAGRIRDVKEAVRERLDVEHDFSNIAPLTATGRHLPGKTSVAFSGTTTEINALTGMAKGAIAWDTTLKVWKYYSGAAWVITDIDHGQLSGKSDDDHQQYLKLDGRSVNQTISQDIEVTAGIKIDTRDISADGAQLDTNTTEIATLRTDVDSLMGGEAATRIFAYVNLTHLVAPGGKVQFNGELYDTLGEMVTDTFTPTVTRTYNVSGVFLGYIGVGLTVVQVQIYKNSLPYAIVFHKTSIPAGYYSIPFSIDIPLIAGDLLQVFNTQGPMEFCGSATLPYQSYISIRNI